MIKFEDSGVRYNIVYCLTQNTAGCSEANRVITYFPECGAGIWSFKVEDFLDGMNKVKNGDANGYREAAAAYKPAHCS